MISIVVPTYNESENIRELIRRIATVALQHALDIEIVIVDDSSADDTIRIAQNTLRTFPQVHGSAIVRTTPPRSLSLSVLDGFARAHGEIIGVMDADLSHPPESLPLIVKPLLENSADLSVGSRYIRGGAIAGWPLHRKIISKGACLMAAPLTPIKDITSGFFFFKRTIIDGVKLDPEGFKIGLEVFIKGHHTHAVEVPYIFIDRKHGTSKMNTRQVRSYLRHLVKLYRYAITSRRT